MERDEQEELKCTKAFVLVGGTMTTCTVSSKKKQAAIRGKIVENYEKVLERCKQIPGGFDRKAMAIQIFATPVLCFDSELTLHTVTTLTRLDGKVHAILSQDDEMEVSSADIYTAGKRAPDPSEKNCEILEKQKL